MTQENEIKRPTQDMEHEPIKQLDNSEKGGKVSQALETVTTTAEKVQRQPVIAHLIRATERFNDGWVTSLVRLSPISHFCR